MESIYYDDIVNGAGVNPDTWYFYEEAIESYKMITKNIFDAIGDKYEIREFGSIHEHEIQFKERMHLEINGCEVTINRIYLDVEYVYFEYVHSVRGHVNNVDVKHENLESLVFTGVWCD